MTIILVLLTCFAFPRGQAAAVVFFHCLHIRSAPPALVAFVHVALTTVAALPVEARGCEHFFQRERPDEPAPLTHAGLRFLGAACVGGCAR